MKLHKKINHYLKSFPHFTSKILKIKSKSTKVRIIYSETQQPNDPTAKTVEIKFKHKKLESTKYITHKLGWALDRLSTGQEWIASTPVNDQLSLNQRSLHTAGDRSISHYTGRSRFILRSLKGSSIIHPNFRMTAAVIGPPVMARGESVGKFIARIGADHSSVQTGTPISSNVKVFVVDTGVQPDHPDLNVDATLSRDFTGYGSWADANGHGTHVAGIIGAKKGNGVGIVGVAPGVPIVAVRVLDANGSGSLSMLLNGIDYILKCINENPTFKVIVNMSLGFDKVVSAADSAVTDLAKRAIVCVAAGNSGRNASQFSPARVAGAVTVGAYSDRNFSDSKYTYKTNTLTAWSNYGSVVDLLAPGAGIYSTYIGSSYATLSGTSMATPVVTGSFVALASSAPSSVSRDTLVSRSTPITQTNYDGTTGSNPRITLTRTANSAGTTTISGYSGSS